MHRLVSKAHGFAVFETARGVIVQKPAAPLVESLLVSPFLLAGCLLGLVGVVTAAYVPIATWRGAGYGKLEQLGALGLGTMMFLGAAIAWLGVAHLIIAVSPGARCVDRGTGHALCGYALGRLVYWRRKLVCPFAVVAQLYESRGDPCFRLFLRDAKGRRFMLTIPTLVGSRVRARRIVMELGMPVASRLDASMVIEIRTRRGWRSPEILRECSSPNPSPATKASDWHAN